MIVERTFPHAVESVGRARRFAVDALGDVAPDILDSIAVMVSELATNSVRHAASAFTIAVEHDHQRIRVAVSDAGDRLPRLRTPEPREPSGRGLQIVRALADEWGVTEAADKQGKTVWFVVVVSPRARHGSVAAGVSRSARVHPTGRPSNASRPRSETERDTEGRGPRCRARRLLKAGRSGVERSS
jgi:anti-sigma regulatory factor (Ser/Thr protein kinase)